MTELYELAKPESEPAVESSPEPAAKGEPQAETEEANDIVLGILDDDIDEVLNALGDDDVNLDDLKSELTSLKYMPIQFDTISPEYDFHLAFYL